MNVLADMNFAAVNINVPGFHHMKALAQRGKLWFDEVARIPMLDAMVGFFGQKWAVVMEHVGMQFCR